MSLSDMEDLEYAETYNNMRLYKRKDGTKRAQGENPARLFTSATSRSVLSRMVLDDEEENGGKDDA